MKRRTEKPSENVMRFFTPELYRQFNSANDAEADLASTAWESAIQAYQEHLNAIQNEMRSPVKKLAKLELHDWELLATKQENVPVFSFPLEPFGPHPYWSAVATLSLQKDEDVTNLVYALWDEVLLVEQQGDWSFSKKRKHWLYDEIDVSMPGSFLHRILFSDGSVAKIPFLTVLIQQFSISKVDTGSAEKIA
jgi:hypothetical protein